MSYKRPIVCVLGFCHVDFNLAELWLKWAKFLSHHDHGDVSEFNLVVFGTKRITKNQWIRLRAGYDDSPRFFKTQLVSAYDENEIGYPLSADHGFVRALQHCEKAFPGHAVLYCEADTVVMKPSWFRDIVEEYNSHDKAFMGHLVECNINHMAGCGVYGPNWREKAPLIESVLGLKDSGGMFPDGMGYPWDLYAGPEIMKSFHRAKTIHQIWRPAPFNAGNLGLIPPEVGLFHQDKGGSLVFALAESRYPAFMQMLPKPSTYYMLTASGSDVVLDGRHFKFMPCGRSVSGSWWSIYRPRDTAEEMILKSHAGRLGVEAIGEEDYGAMLEQAKRL